MNVFGKITLLCMIHYAVANTTRMGLEWTQRLDTSIAFLSKTKDVELFYDLLPGENNNSLAVLHWMHPEVDRPAGLNVTTITHGLGGASVRECTFPAEKDITFLYPVKVKYLRSDRVLVYLRQEHKTKGSIQIPQVIDVESCQLKEGTDIMPQVGYEAITIVSFKNHFDVIYENKTDCPGDSMCRISFDHDGKKISEPTTIAQKITGGDELYPMNYDSGKEGLVVASGSSGVYSPARDAWIPTEDIKGTKHSYSNGTGYASVCWLTENLRNVKCTWLDGSYRDKKGADVVITVPLNRRVKKRLDTYNTPIGDIVLMKEGQEDGKTVIYGDKIDHEGKCERYTTTEIKNELKRVQLTFIPGLLSCTSLVTRNPVAFGENSYSSLFTYRFDTECRNYVTDLQPVKIDCGKNYAK